MSPPTTPTPLQKGISRCQPDRKPSTKPASPINSSSNKLPTPPMTPKTRRRVNKTPQTVFGDQSTESAGSEDVQPSGSGYFDFEKETSLDEEFSSVPKVMTALTEAYLLYKDPTSFRALGDVFANTITTVSANIESSFRVNLSSERFIFAKSIVRLMLNIFRTAVQKVSEGERIRSDKMLDMRDAYEHALMVHDSLRCLYRIGVEVRAKDKPLPPLPTASSLPRPQLSRSTSPPKTPTRSTTLNQTAPSTHRHEESITLLCTKQSTPSPKEKTFIWSWNRTESPSPAPKTPQLPDTSIRLPCSSPTPLEHTFDGPRSEEIYNQRWTAVYFGESSFPVDNLTLEEGTDGLKFDKNYKIKAATLPALIRILTSREGIRNPTLSQSIFNSFRLFATPTEFFDELRKRFETKPPTPYDSNSQEGASEWAVKLANIHTRVLAVIYTWLDQHWKVDTDNVILDELRSFVQHLDEKSIPRGIAGHILTKIGELEHCSEQDLFDKRLRDIASVGSLRSPPLQRTHFVFPDVFPTSMSDGLDLLDTTDGREELARHLTLKMSGLYRRLDPTKVVRFWYEKGDKARDYPKYKTEVPGVRDLSAVSSYGEQLTLWVISSVVECEDLQSRADRLGLWADVASRCIAHHDYATAHNIYACLNFSSVLRMKETILVVPESSKQQYKKLSDFFDDRANTLFKQTFNHLLPTIPSTTPLLQDIIQAKARSERESRSMPPRIYPSAAPTSAERLIAFDQCKVNQQAIKYLNKALIAYQFEQNKELVVWLEGCIKPFVSSSSRDTQAIYDKLHESSLSLEPRCKELDFLSQPWHFVTSKPAEPLNGSITQLDIFVVESVEQKRAAKRLLSLLTDLKRPRL